MKIWMKSKQGIDQEHSLKQEAEVREDSKQIALELEEELVSPKVVT
jgi:hypothetical protein